MSDEELETLRLLVIEHEGEWWTEKLAAALDEIDRLRKIESEFIALVDLP